MGAATRLLAVKRPDRFLVITGANKRPIREGLEHPANLEGYLRLHKYIWSLPWFDTPKPDDADECRVWRARVALLDVLFYEVLP
jgi:hypothetical protein